jgi:hypothetical protein
MTRPLLHLSHSREKGGFLNRAGFDAGHDLYRV